MLLGEDGRTQEKEMLFKATIYTIALGMMHLHERSSGHRQRCIVIHSNLRIHKIRSMPATQFTDLTLKIKLLSV
jgi:hypothetical protein